MIIIYTPEDGPEERHDARKLKTSQAQIVSRNTGMSWPEIKNGILNEDLTAMRGVIHLFKKLSDPTLKFDDFDPGVDEMKSRFDAREVTQFAEEIVKAGGAPEDIDEAFGDLERHAADPAAAAAFIKEFRDSGPKEQDVSSPTSASDD